MSVARALLCAVALVSVGCGSTGLPARDAQSREAVDELQLRVIELQRKAAVAELELARLRDRLARLEGGGAAPASGSPAPPERRPEPEPVPPPPPPIQRAVPVVDEEPLEEVDLDDSMPTRAAVTTPTVPVPDPTPPAERPMVEAPPSAANQPVSAAGRELYDRGYALFHRERYVDAEAAFRQFLLDHGQTELADNAGYWIGESRFARGDHRGALAAFQEAVERYPGGNRVPDSILKAGRCLEELGDVETARQRYREITRRFPGTAAAAVAADRLAAIP